jgi:tripartite-type tricarboxylate transporter receptor subunit TctC
MKRRDLVLAAPGLFAFPAQAQQPAWPTREIQIVVPFEPGGNMAVLAHLLADAMNTMLPQRTIVLYRSGADGNIGTAWVARAEPDGRTLLLTGSGFLVSPLLHADAGYDPMRDFEPIARFAIAPSVLLVHESLRGITLPQLLRRPSNSIAFASAGHGQSSHVAAEVFMARTGVKWLHVPYRGTGPAVRGLLGGEVQLMFVPAGAVAGAVGTGKVFPLAVAHASRLASLPDVPTLSELGVTGADYSQWYGVFAPAGTPPSICNQLSDIVVKVFEEARMRKRLDAAGVEPATLGRRDFASFLAADLERVKAVVKSGRIKRD